MTTLEMTPNLELNGSILNENTLAPTSFKSLNLSENILKAISDLNFTEPSSIQAEAILRFYSAMIFSQKRLQEAVKQQHLPFLY